MNVYHCVDKPKKKDSLNKEVQDRQMKQVSLDCVKYLSGTNLKIKPSGQIKPILTFVL